MGRISAVAVASVAWVACHHEGSPSTQVAPAAEPPSNRAAVRAEPAASTDILAFLPIDSEVVLRIDFRALRGSALWAEYQPQLMEALGPGLATLQAQCGFDPIRTIDSMIVGVRDTTQATGVVVVRGWDRDRILACSAADRSSTTKVTNEHGILTFTNAGRQMIAAFADRTTMVLDSAPTATKDGLRAVMKSGAPLRRSPGFLAMLEQVEPDATLWMLMNGNARALARRSAQLKMRGIYAGIHVAATVAAVAHVRLETAAQASQVAAAVDAQLQSARPFFDKLTASSDGEVLTFACELSSAQLRTLAGIAVAAFQQFGVKP